MSVLGALDATRLCARWSQPSTDAAALAQPVPTVSRAHRTTSPVWSWRALVRNPHALLLTGMVGTSLVAEAAVRAVR